MQVSEIFEYNFDGDFNGMIRSLGIKGSDGLQYFKASEYSPEHKELEYTQSVDGDMVTYKIYDQSSNEIKSFLLEYQLKNVVTLYNDTAELYWKFFDQSNTSPISHIKIEIELPKGEVSAEELKVFGHGPLNGTVSIQEDKKILYEVNSLSSGEMVEVRILFPTRLISSSYKIIKENKFAEIMKEELGWAKKADNEVPLAFYVSNAADESMVINYNKKISQVVGLTLGVRPYQNITKLDIQIPSHLHNSSDIQESVQEKIEKEDLFIYYIYRFMDYKYYYEDLTQIVNEKTKIFEGIRLTLYFGWEIVRYGSLEEAFLAIIEIINQQSGIYLEKEIDYQIIDEFIQLRKGIRIKGIDNSIIYELLRIQGNDYLVVTLFKNTEK
jgi:hypothetical protein